MIEGSWDRRLYGIQALGDLHATPPWRSADTVAGGFGERPIPADATLSELHLVSGEDGGIASPSDPDSYPSPCSPISQLKFASPEETMTIATVIESEPPSRDSLSFSATNSSSPDTHDDQARMIPIEEFSPTMHTTPVSPRQPGWITPRLDGSATLDSKRAGKRPLPEVPGYAQSRPLPPRPIKIATVPGWWGLNKFPYLPPQEFMQGCSKDHFVASRPVSDSGPDIPSQPAEEEWPNHDTTPEDTPPVHLIPAPPGISPSAASPSLPPSLSSSTLPLLPDTLAHSSAEIPSPTSFDLVTAAGLTVIGENGEQVMFGTLFGDRKVVAIFVCYFWCLCCKNYARSILSSVTPETLEHRGVNLVVIGNGTPGAIKVYKRMVKMSFKVYTDPSLQLHNALGLHKINNAQARGRSKRGGRWTSFRVAVRTAAARPAHNDLERLGGEFAFGPGLKSSFVHKMQSPRDHTPIVEILEAVGVKVHERIIVRGAGVESPTAPASEAVDISIPISASTLDPSILTSTDVSFAPVTSSAVAAFTSSDGEDMRMGLAISTRVAESLEPEPPTPVIADEAEWMTYRHQSLARIKQKREARRKGMS